MRFPRSRGVYLVSWVPPLLAIAGNLTGGWYVLGASLFFTALIIPDWIFKSPESDNADNESAAPDFILLAQAILQTAAIGSLMYGVYMGILTPFFIPGAIISTGLSSGCTGLVAAHEMIHRRSVLFRWMGIWLLFLNRYTHYFVEHLQGHHKSVGLGNDPTTARRGENFYRFFLRIIPQQFGAALRIEAGRLRKSHHPPYGLRNFAILSLLMEIVALGVILHLLGWLTLAAFFGQSLVSRFFWETGSYVQHYGLERVEGEQVDEGHSWQSNSLISRIMLFEIVRHSDHHCHVTTPYQELHARDKSPELPAGGFGLFPAVLIPPVWFHLAHKRLQVVVKRG